MEFVRNNEIFSLEWLSKCFGREVKECLPRDQEKMGGMSATMVFLDVIFADGDEKVPILLKKSPTGTSSMRVAAGTAREALFYSEFAENLRPHVSKAFWSYADMKTGEMAILMECIHDCIPSGTFFGPANPNNWGLVDGKIDDLCKGNPNALIVTEKAFAIYARMHAKYWRPSYLLKDERYFWLNGHDRLNGAGRENFHTTHEISRAAWLAMVPAITDGSHYVKWDAHLVKCLTVSFSKINWDAYQKALQVRPYSLVHGDAHPHNFLWAEHRTENAHLKLIDFEMIGLGSPSQELGQYLISHMEPPLRKENERKLVEDYYQQVRKHLEDKEGDTVEIGDYTFESCWQEYIDGGFGRWAWFVGGFDVFFGGEKNSSCCQFFHDQLAAFAHDHFHNPQDAPMPRI
eukprot:GSChrysophyteH1.ASY1.ANO1.1345.1 assembled CDS